MGGWERGREERKEGKKVKLTCSFLRSTRRFWRSSGSKTNSCVTQLPKPKTSMLDFKLSNENFPRSLDRSRFVSSTLSPLLPFPPSSSLTLPSFTLPFGGSSQTQKFHVSTLLTHTIPSLTSALEDLVLAEEECAKANVEENDYTVLRAEDLTWEVELVRNSLGRRVAFIENQVSRYGLLFGFEKRIGKNETRADFDFCVREDRFEGDYECESSFSSFCSFSSSFAEA